jgi:hypothetical protein
MDKLIVVGMALLVVVYLVAQVRSLLRWERAWKLASLAPLGYSLFVVVRIVIDTRQDPTAHNLWPFEVILAVTGALIGLGMIATLRRWSAARRPRR